MPFFRLNMVTKRLLSLYSQKLYLVSVPVMIIDAEILCVLVCLSEHLN